MENKNSPTINNSFGQIGKDLRSNIPHIKIGGNNNLPNQGGLFNPGEQDILNKIKKWGMVIVVAIVICYALYRSII